MPRAHYGPEAKKQTKRLLEALLAYANHELENCERIQIRVNWKTENQLVVRTKVRFLEELTAKSNGKLTKEQIKEALKRLEDFLEILEDNRPTTQGSEDWHFTLKLWHRRYDKEANLKQFDLEWERRRPEKSKQVTGEEFKESVPDTPPVWQASEHRPKLVDVLEVPEGSVALSSAFYVERPP